MNDLTLIIPSFYVLFVALFSLDMLGARKNMHLKYKSRRHNMRRIIAWRLFGIVIVGAWVMVIDRGLESLLNVFTVFFIGSFLLEGFFTHVQRRSIPRALSNVVSTVGFVIFVIITKYWFFHVMHPVLLIVLMSFSIALIVVVGGPFYEKRMMQRVSLIPFVHAISESHFTRRLRVNHVYMLSSNAFNLGFNALLWDSGRKQKLLVSKRLLVSLDSNDVTSILMHEIGHSYNRHMPKRFVGILLCIALYVSVNVVLFNSGEYALDTPVFWTIVFLANVNLYKFLKLGVIALMHHQEYQADAYALKHGHGLQLKEALRKLEKLTRQKDVNPLYTKLFQAHPDFESRIARLS